MTRSIRPAIHRARRGHRVRDALLAAAAVAACSSPPPPPPVEPPSAQTLVARVTAAELGRIHLGFALSAVAQAPGAGWRAPRLRPVLGVPDATGALEFEFVATPPDSIDPAVSQRLNATALLAGEQLAGAAVLRVIGRDANAEIRLVDAK